MAYLTIEDAKNLAVEHASKAAFAVETGHEYMMQQAQAHAATSQAYAAIMQAQYLEMIAKKS